MIDPKNLKLIYFTNLVNFKNIFSKANIETFDEIRKLDFDALQIKLNSSFIDTYKLINEIEKINLLLNQNQIEKIYSGEIVDSSVDNLDSQRKTSLECLNLSVRSYNALKSNGVDYVEQLYNYTQEDFFKIKNLGIKSIKEIQSVLRDFNPDLYTETDFDQTEVYGINTDLLINDLNLSVRTKNCLLNEGYNKISEIINFQEADFYNIQNMGKKSVCEIMDLIKSLKKSSLKNEKDIIDKIVNSYGIIEDFKYKSSKISSFSQFEMLKSLTFFDDVKHYSFEELYLYLRKLISETNCNFKNMEILSDFLFRYLSLNTSKINISITDRELEIIKLRKFKTLEEIGLKYTLTRERVRQIEVKTLRKLKECSQANSLSDYFIDDVYYRYSNNSLLPDDVYNKFYDVLSELVDVVRISCNDDYFYCKEQIADEYYEIAERLKSKIKSEGFVLLEDFDELIKYNEIFDSLITKLNIKRGDNAYYLREGTTDRVLAYIKHFGEIDLSDSNMSKISNELRKYLDIYDFDKHALTSALTRRNVISIGSGKYKIMNDIDDISDSLMQEISILIEKHQIISCSDIVNKFKDKLPKDITPTILYYKFKSKFPIEFQYGGTSLNISILGQKASKSQIVYDYLLNSTEPVSNVQLMSISSTDKAILSGIISQNKDIFNLDDVYIWLFSKMNIEKIIDEIKKYISTRNHFFINDIYKFILLKYRNELKENYISSSERFFRIMQKMCFNELQNYEYNRFKKKYIKKYHETDDGFDFEF